MSTPSISVVNCGERVELRLDLAPVVLGRPVARELLKRRQLHALRPIGDELRQGQRVASMRRRSSASFSSGTSTMERTDVAGGLDGGAHDDLPWSSWRGPRLRMRAEPPAAGCVRCRLRSSGASTGRRTSPRRRSGSGWGAPLASPSSVIAGTVIDGLFREPLFELGVLGLAVGQRRAASGSCGSRSRHGRDCRRTLRCARTWRRRSSSRGRRFARSASRTRAGTSRSRRGRARWRSSTGTTTAARPRAAGAACRLPGCRSGSRSPRPGRCSVRARGRRRCRRFARPSRSRRRRLSRSRARPSARLRRARAPPARRCGPSRRRGSECVPNPRRWGTITRWPAAASGGITST